jgi:hypothetical protein
MEDFEGKYLTCKLKHWYEKLAENIALVIVCVFILACALGWIAMNLYVAGVIIGRIPAWDPTVMLPAIAIVPLFGAINGFVALIPLFEDRHKKDHVDTNLFQECLYVLTTTLFVIDIGVIVIATMFIPDIIGKILYGIVEFIIIIPSIYIVLYNACETRLYIAGVGRYKKEEKKEEEN